MILWICKSPVCTQNNPAKLWQEKKHLDIKENSNIFPKVNVHNGTPGAGVDNEDIDDNMEGEEGEDSYIIQSDQEPTLTFL